MKHIVFAISALSLLMTISACAPVNGNLKCVDSDCWLRNDSIHLSITTLDSGSFAGMMAVRVLHTYPMQEIWLGFRETIRNDSCRAEKGIRKMRFRLAGADGQLSERGLNYAEYTFPVDTINMGTQDTLDVTIFHYMPTDTIKGVSEVGWIIEKIDN